MTQAIGLRTAAVKKYGVNPAAKVLLWSGDNPCSVIGLGLVKQGKVAIKYTISTDGSVTECAVVTGSGKPRLDDAACTMVKKRWKFKPATQDGKPVAKALTAEVAFKLADETTREPNPATLASLFPRPVTPVVKPPRDPEVP